MNKINIRKAKLSELTKLLEIEQLIIDAERPFEENIKNGKVTYYDLEALISHEDSIVLVAEINNQLIASGYAKIKKSLSYLKDDYHAYLGFMYVDPKQRGKGINKLIIDQLIDWSRKKGMSVVCLEVLDRNDNAVNAYKKTGFQKNLVEMRLNLDD